MFLSIWRMIAPLITIAGVLYFIIILVWDFDVPLELAPACILGGVCALVGIILGFTGWVEDVPPRFFWIKSNVDLLDNRVGYSLKLGIQFFLLPSAIALIISFVFYT